ncbi:MAG: uracil-DNA glycosylase [candidate division WOR-3 bacterium]|jgi:uracil-DNA glycosylase family 4
MENYQQNKIVEVLKLLKYMGIKEVDDSLVNGSPFEDLTDEVKNCTKCNLHKGRKNAVFGKGPINARIMLIGEAPGMEEDIQGVPFVGRAGKKLDDILSEAGIDVDEVFITNVVKCRPPGNRNPESYEMMKCNPYLLEQIRVIHPEVIVLLGNIALSLVTGNASGITKMRGKTLEYMSIPAIPTFHPAYILRNPGSEKIVIEDFKKALRSIS